MTALQCGPTLERKQGRMKRSLCVFIALLLAAPLFAQDEGGGGGGLPSSLFGGDAPASRGNEANPMDAVKKFLAQSKVTLGGDQEKTLKPIIESAFKQVQATVEKFGPPPGQGGERGGARGQGGQRGDRRGGGGAQAGGGAPGGNRGGRGGA